MNIFQQVKHKFNKKAQEILKNKDEETHYIN